MVLDVVRLPAGQGRLGRWGTVVATGPRSAELRLTSAQDVLLPESLAEDLTSGVLLLNEVSARLLFLPYSSESIHVFDLAEGAPACEPLVLLRDPDKGMRISEFAEVPALGVVFRCESSLALLAEDGHAVWRCDEDFGSWSIEGVTFDEVLLWTGDWGGGEFHQRRSLRDGRRIG